MNPASAATSRADDRLAIRRAAWRIWICVAVIVAAFVCPRFVPDDWTDFIIPTRVRVPYSDPNSANPQEASGSIGVGHVTNAGIVTSVMIRVQIRSLGVPSEAVVTSEPTVAAVRAAFIKDNAQSLGADAGPFFDRAMASPDRQATKSYLWRNIVSGVLMALGMGTYVALIVVFFATRTLLAAKRRSRLGLCTQCGYDLHGLSPVSPCPECGTVQTLAAIN